MSLNSCNSSSIGLDFIAITFLKNICNRRLDILLFILNSQWFKGIVSDSWLHFHVYPFLNITLILLLTVPLSFHRYYVNLLNIWWKSLWLLSQNKFIYFWQPIWLSKGPRALHHLQVTFIRLFAIRNVSQGLLSTLKGLLIPFISLHLYLDFHFFSIPHSLKLYLISFLSPLFSSYFSF